MARSRPTTPVETEIATRMRPPREGSIPFDGLDREGMPPRADLARTERRAILGLSVQRRSTWPGINELDERIGELTRRHGEAQEAVRDLMQQRGNAPTVDADSLASWELGGRKGPKPAPTVDTLDRQVADAELTRDALERATDVVLEEKGAFVERHRDGLAAVAEQQTVAARTRMLALIDELERTRDTLIEYRRAAVWARCFPDAAASAETPAGQIIARGLAQPIVDTLGLRPAPQLVAARVLDLLRKDAEVLATAMTPEQRKLLGGDAEPTNTVWTDTPEGREQSRRERQEARDRYQREWGQPAPW